MSQCACDGMANCFNPERAAKELARYRRNGPLKNTHLLVQALQTQAQARRQLQSQEPGQERGQSQGQGVAGLTLLDIGGGVGAIAHALLEAGVRQAADVDASAAYLAVARQEAERRGLGERIDFKQGDFVTLAPTIAPADIVTLDRVICCYADMPALVRLSAARAQQLYGLVYPRDPWWVRLLNPVVDLAMRVLRTPLRFYIHPTAAVEATIQREGLERCFHRKAGLWQIVVYARIQPRAAALPPNVSDVSDVSNREQA